MYWLERAHSRSRGSGFVVPIVVCAMSVAALSTVFFVIFIPKMILDGAAQRKHRERRRQYQQRREYFEARGWGWGES